MVPKTMMTIQAVSKIDELAFCSAIVSKHRLPLIMNPTFTTNLNQANWRK